MYCAVNPRHFVRPLFAPGCVASPRKTPGITSSARLARNENDLEQNTPELRRSTLVSSRVRQILTLATFLISIFGFAVVAYGHALQPGYLELRLIDDERYSVVWKKPANRGRPMAISAVLPGNCDPREPEQTVWDGAAYFARWTTLCTGGLEGGVIQIAGLDQTSTDVLVRFDFADGTSESRRLTPGDSSFTVPAIPSSLEVVKTYLALGFQHILSGLDHLLFVLALLLLVDGVRRLVITVTAFTLAHSLTLAGATLGYVQIPGPPVEATIALSIMFVASEIMRRTGGAIPCWLKSIRGLSRSHSASFMASDSPAHWRKLVCRKHRFPQHCCSSTSASRSASCSLSLPYLPS